MQSFFHDGLCLLHSRSLRVCVLFPSMHSDDEFKEPPATPSASCQAFVELQSPTFSNDHGTDSHSSSSSSSDSSSRSSAARPSASRWFGAVTMADVSPAYLVDKAGEAAASDDVFASDKSSMGDITYLFGPGSARHDAMFLSNSSDSNDSSAPADSPPPAQTGGAGHEKRKPKLGQFYATAISGNNITSSVFYVTGLGVASGGVWAPICMVLVALTLRLFCSIYGEAVTALPLNGGAYNVLLNTTSEKSAAVAACLSILSYMATAVVSASRAMAYLQYIYPGTQVTAGTIVLLLVFAGLCVWVSRTAPVSLCTSSPSTSPRCPGPQRRSRHLPQHRHPRVLQPPPIQAIVYGFAAATLGVSGFETSANFVEERRTASS